MSIKQKLLNAISAHPKLAALGVGLAITMAIGTAIGMLDQQHLAFAVSAGGAGGGGGGGAGSHPVFGLSHNAAAESTAFNVGIGLNNGN